MNVLIFVASILITYVDCFNRKTVKNFSVKSTAFENITEHLLAVERDIYLVNYGLNAKPLASLIMKSLGEKIAPYSFSDLEDKVINVTNFKGYPMNGSGIFIFDSIASFKNFTFSSIYYINKFAKQFQFYVYCLDATYEDIATLSDIRLKHFFNFLLEDETSIKLMTFVWYFPDSCNISQLIATNVFTKATKKWKTKTFSIEKNRKFYGCPLVIGIVFTNTLHQVFGKSSQTVELHKKIFSGLAKNLNYSLEYKTIYGNASESFDFSIDFHSLSNRALFLDKYYDYYTHRFNTQPYIFRSFQLAVPLGVEYNDFEKLLLPFDSQVWNWIMVTFISAFLIIFILKFFAKAREFVIGSSVTTPVLNVLMIFSGTSQVTMPGRNFARFLVMQFIIFSMIIRTAWQGKMFEFLQIEMRRPEVQSIDEMIRKDFTFYMTGPFVSIYNGSDFSQKAKIKRVKIEELMFNYTPKLYDPAFKGAVQIYYDRLKIQALETNGTFLKRIFKERLATDMYSLRFGPLQKLHEVFDTKLQQLFIAGVINFYEKDYEEFITPERYEHLQQKGPQVLTMENLRAGFVVWLVSIIFAMFAFMFEWLKTLGEYFLVKLILNKFYEQKSQTVRERNFLLTSKRH